MPVDLRAMNKRSAHVVVELSTNDPKGAPETIAIDYDPRGLTSEVYNAFLAYRKSEGFDEGIDLLSRILVGWDVLSAGKACKPTKDNLTLLTIQEISLLIMGVVNDVSNPPSREDSPDS